MFLLLVYSCSNDDDCLGHGDCNESGSCECLDNCDSNSACSGKFKTSDLWIKAYVTFKFVLKPCHSPITRSRPDTKEISAFPWCQNK